MLNYLNCLIIINVFFNHFAQSYVQILKVHGWYKSGAQLKTGPARITTLLITDSDYIAFVYIRTVT